ncbi:hypothetical protein DIPPA_05024 [Diplonema papillatum]|nr:hypothetical protein DIPPA_05024 [Diplonema papillatum]|eukprot:gene8951-13857_t
MGESQFEVEQTAVCVPGTEAEPVPECDAAIAEVSYPWWRSGDGEAFATIVSDNLATVVVLISVLLGVGFDPVTVFAKILPGIGLSICVGNFYYAFQAGRQARLEGRTDITAQPYGVNTPGAFAFLYTIMFGIYFEELGRGASNKEAGESAYRATCLANLISGLLEVAGAFIGPLMLRYIPFPALTTPLAGIAVTYLSLNHLVEVFRHGLVGLLPLFIVLTAYFGGIRYRYIPAVLVAIVVGTAIAWMGSYKDKQEIEDAWGYIENDRWQQFWDFPMAYISKREAKLAIEYMSVIIPVSVTNFMATLEVVSSAHIAGDKFPVVETMIVDGLGTAIGALFGSPFGTTVYIGHPAYKAMNGSRGYSLANGVAMFVLCFTGLASLFMAILSHEALMCIVIFVGLAIAQQTFTHCPTRQYPTVILGFLPHFAEWAATMLFNDRAGAVQQGRLGLWYLSQGAMFTSLCMTVTLYFALNRNFIPSAIAAFLASLCAMIGLMHDSRIYGPSDDATSPKYEWFFAWLLVCGYMLILHAAQKYKGWVDEPIIEDCSDFHLSTPVRMNRNTEPATEEPIEIMDTPKEVEE